LADHPQRQLLTWKKGPDRVLAGIEELTVARLADEHDECGFAVVDRPQAELAEIERWCAAAQGKAVADGSFFASARISNALDKAQGLCAKSCSD